MTDDRIAVTETIPLPDVLRALTRELTAMTDDPAGGYEARAAELTVRLLIDTDAGEPRFHVVGPQTPETAGTTTHTLKLTLQPLLGEPARGEFAVVPESESQEENNADTLSIPFPDTGAQSAESLRENVPEPAHIPETESAEPHWHTDSAAFQHSAGPEPAADSEPASAAPASDAHNAMAASGDEAPASPAPVRTAVAGVPEALGERDSGAVTGEEPRTGSPTPPDAGESGPGLVTRVLHKASQLLSHDEPAAGAESRSGTAATQSGYDTPGGEPAGESVRATAAQFEAPYDETHSETATADIAPAAPEPHPAITDEPVAEFSQADTLQSETSAGDTDAAEATATGSQRPTDLAAEDAAAALPETASAESYSEPPGAADATVTEPEKPLVAGEPTAITRSTAAGPMQSPSLGTATSDADGPTANTPTTRLETSHGETDSEPMDTPPAQSQAPSDPIDEPVLDDTTEAAAAVAGESTAPVDGTPAGHRADPQSMAAEPTAEPGPETAGPEDNPTAPIPRTPEETSAASEPDRIAPGGAYSDLDEEHAEVIARYEKILVDRERAMGPLHRHTLISAGNLARAYREAGRSSQAIDVYERVLTDSENTFGPQDLDTLIFRGSLARCYREAGRMVEAIDLYERTLADSEQGFGPDHKNTLTARHNLALAYREDGRLDDAIELYRICLADSERLLGSNHRDTLITCDSLASCLREAGKVAKATALDERLLTARRRVLGPEHPDTLHSTINLASDRAAANRASEAADLYEQALSTSERVLGPDHPLSERARIGLAHGYAEVGRANEAAELFERLLADCERQLGPDHRHTLIARNNLAVAYHDAGRFAEAIEAHTRTAEDRERLLGPDHPDTLKSREHLAYSYEAQLRARTSGPQIPVPQE